MHQNDLLIRIKVDRPKNLRAHRRPIITNHTQMFHLRLSFLVNPRAVAVSCYGWLKTFYRWLTSRGLKPNVTVETFRFRKQRKFCVPNYYYYCRGGGTGSILIFQNRYDSRKPPRPEILLLATRAKAPLRLRLMIIFFVMNSAAAYGSGSRVLF